MARHVVFGCNGPVGLGLMEALASRGHRVVGVCRSGRSEAPPGVTIAAGDAGDVEGTKRLASGADVVHCTVGLPYPEWTAKWPPIVRGLVAACEQHGARLVFADNLYAYGPQSAPLSESTPVNRFGRKPALRAWMADTMLEAHARGRLRVALVRASDFYGPRVTNALLGERVFPNALAGKAAQLLGDIDQPHAYTYVPDFVRALVTVSDHDDAFGEVWHVPNAPAQTTRAIVEQVFRLAGREPKIKTMPGWLLAGLSLVSPLMRELREMGFQGDRPYLVDHTKFIARFAGEPTSLEEGLRATLDWYRRASAKTQAE